MGAGLPESQGLCRLRVSVSQSGDTRHIHRLLDCLLLQFQLYCRLWHWIRLRGRYRSAASCAFRCRNRAVWILSRCYLGGLHRLPEIRADIFPGLWNRRKLFLSRILAGLHPGVFLPTQNKRQPGGSAQLPPVLPFLWRKPCQLVVKFIDRPDLL